MNAPLFGQFFIAESQHIVADTRRHHYRLEIAAITFAQHICQRVRHLPPGLYLAVVGDVLDHLCDAVIIFMILVER